MTETPSPTNPGNTPSTTLGATNLPLSKTSPNSRPKLIITIGILAVLIAISGGAYWWWQNHTTISTDNAKVDSDTIELSTRISGRMQSISVQEGQKVSSGEVLFQLETTQLEAELLKAQANLETAIATFEKIKAGARSEELELAQITVQRSSAAYDKKVNERKQSEIDLLEVEKELERKEALYQAQVISLQDIETIRNKVDNYQTRYAAAEASRVEAENILKDAQVHQSLINNGPLPQDLEIYAAQVKQADAACMLAQSNYEASTIKAPANGTVVKINAQIGEMVTSGQSALTLIDLDNVWIKANIDETKIKRVGIGQAVRVVIDAYPGQVFNGTISDIGNAAGSVFSLIPNDNSSGNFTKVTQRVPVKIKLESSDYPLYPGMSAKVKIFAGDQ